MALPSYDELVGEKKLPSYEELTSPAQPSYEELTSAPAEDMPTSDAGPAPAPAARQPYFADFQSPEQQDAYTRFEAEAAKAGSTDHKEKLLDLQDQYRQDYLPKKQFAEEAERFFSGVVENGQTPEKLQNARLDFALAENKLRKQAEHIGFGGVAPIFDDNGGVFVPPISPREQMQAKENARLQTETEAEKKRQEQIKILGREPQWWETFPRAIAGGVQDFVTEGMRTFQNSNLWDAATTQEMAMKAHDTNVIAGLGKGVSNDVARGTADVLMLMAGNPAGKAGILAAAFKGAELARARTFDETGDENKANQAALNSIITLPILLATGQAASKFASKLLPEGASALKVGATELAAGATANVGTDLLIHAVEGKPYDWRSFTADTLFALHGAWSRFAEAAQAKGDTAGAKTAQQATQKINEALSEKGETPPATGEPNAITQQSSTQPNGDVLNPEGTSQSTGEVPTNESGAGVPPRGQGEVVAPDAQGEAQPNLGPGAANVAEFTPGERLGAYNAQIDEQRAARGLPPLMSEARKPNPKLWDDAVARVERDPEEPAMLTAEINSGKKKSITDEEQSMLLYRIVDLHNRMDTEAQRVLDPYADEADRAEARVRYERLEQERQATEEADRKAGTASGRSLQARKIMADENYNFAGIMKRVGIASRKPISPEQTVQIKVDAEKVKAAKDKLDEETAKVEAEKEIAKVKGTKAEVPLDEQRTKIAAHLEAEQKKGTAVEDLKSFIQKLAENFVKSGVTEINALTTAVHGVVEPIFKGITQREVRDLFSNYGEFHALDKDPLKTEIRRLKSEGQSVSKLEDVQSGKAPSKTGNERQAPSDLKRRLEKEVRETMKKNGITSTDPATQLKSSLDARKTAMKNQIKDLTFQIETGEKPRAGEPPPSDAELEGLRKLRDNVRETLQTIEGDPQMTDEQRAKIVVAQLDRQIAEHQRILKNGAVRVEGGKVKPLTTPEIEARRATLDALKAQVEEIRAADQTAKEEKAFDDTMARADELEKKLASGDLSTKGGKELGPDTELVAAAKDRLAALRDQLKAARAASPEATQAKIDAAKASVEESIAKLDKRIQAEDFTSSKKAQPTTPEIEALRAERDAMRKLFNELKSATLPKLTREQIAQKALATSLANRTAALQAKLAAGDFTKPPKRTPTPLTPALLKAKAAYEDAKLQVDRGIEKLRLKNRTFTEKGADMLAKWTRASILSGPITLAKLTAAAAYRVASIPAEELAGSALRRVFRRAAARAPYEGRGLEPGLEAKAVAKGVTRGLMDAWQTVKTGHGNLDAAFGKKDIAPRSVLDIFGAIHGALKAPVKRTFFERSMAKRIASASEAGVDVTDPAVQTQIIADAYKDAQRSIFMQDNRVASLVSQMAARLEAPDRKTGRVSGLGKAGATALRVALPIVKVPTNIVAEIFQHVFGLPYGLGRLAREYSRGIEKLHPDEADAIFRSMKKGSLGTAMLLYGFFAPGQFGGQYSPGLKKDDKEAGFGEMKIGKTKIPKFLIHNPLLETAQVGATIRHVMDQKIKGKTQGLMTGIGRGLLGAVEEAPMFDESVRLSHLTEQNGPTRYFGELARSIGVPQLVQQIARWTDSKKRKPANFTDIIKEGIPGLRQQVPVKQ